NHARVHRADLVCAGDCPLAAAHNAVTQLWQYSAKDLARAFRRGDTSPIELVDSIFGRCPAVNSSINALVHIDEAGARRTAAESERRWRQGCPLGHLDGIPLTVKDNL